MGLLNKLDNVVIENDKRLPLDDMEFCKNEEQRYINAFNAYSQAYKLIEAAHNTEEAIKTEKYDYGYIGLYGDMGVRRFQDAIASCSDRFVSKIISHFNHKYHLALPERTEYENGFKPNYDDSSKIKIASLDYVLDKYIFSKMDGVTFREKGIETIQQENKLYKNQNWNGWRKCWNYEIKGKYIKFQYGVNSVVPILKFFDGGEYELCDEYSHSKVKEITSYKNGSDKVEFTSPETALEFARKYLGYVEMSVEEIERIKAEN